MDIESIFFTIFIIWYFKNYIPENTLNTLHNLHGKATHLLNVYNSVMYPLYFSLEDNLKEDDLKEETTEEVKPEEPKPEVKYEDKFLEDIRKMNKEYVFDDAEKLEEGKQYIELLKKASDERVYQLTQIRNSISQIEIKLIKYDSDEDYCTCDDDDEDVNLGETKEERIKVLVTQLKELKEEKQKLEELFQSKKYIEESLLKINEEARKFIIDKRIDKLDNSHVMEFTPLGNVLMKYDKNKEAFRFYSDSTIPYRYLEVVGRKFVKQFNCRPLFVDMEEELKLAEEKWEKERNEKEEKEEEDKRKKEEAIKNKAPIEEKKKNVFAKFKSYNKESGTGHVSTAAPPKNSIPNKKLTQTQENEKILLKQKANRYTYEGKIANFSFIKKVDRKVIDKKFGMSFADFKKSILKK
jgi:hypothetical protein